MFCLYVLHHIRWLKKCARRLENGQPGAGVSRLPSPCAQHAFRLGFAFIHAQNLTIQSTVTYTIAVASTFGDAFKALRRDRPTATLFSVVHIVYCNTVTNTINYTKIRWNNCDSKGSRSPRNHSNKCSLDVCAIHLNFCTWINVIPLFQNYEILLSKAVRPHPEVSRKKFWGSYS